MSSNSEAQAISELSKPVETLTRGALVAVGSNYNIKDLEQFQSGRNRARGTYKTPNIDDFVEYIDKNNLDGRAPVFVDPDEFCAIAVLNFDVDGHHQGHCDFTAKLSLKPTVVWKKLEHLAHLGHKFKQKDFATFLEDWASVLNATTESGESIHIGEALNAVRNMKIDASASKDSQVSNVSESRSLLERVEASSTSGKLPSYFEITDPAYVGLSARLIKLRLVVNSVEGSPQFALQIVKHELLLNEIIDEFKEQVIDKLPNNPVFIGTFDK